MNINKIKVFGAGSIGNHLAHAARRKGWAVTIVDVDDRALSRTKNEIYPGRYGQWDEAIQLLNANEADNASYDIVIIGTPPDSHLQLAIDSLKYHPAAILIEKPASSLDLSLADELIDKSKNHGTRLFVGYDHVVSESVKALTEMVKGVSVDSVLTIDAEFREHWGGIFAAHPWLSGPWETYLGYTERGGGALAEHSHALNLWQYLARILGAGRVVQVQAMTTVINDGRVNYDQISVLNLKTETGLIGRCVQDVITTPPKKWLSIKCDVGQYDLNFSPELDTLGSQKEKLQKSFKKKRPDDFLAELTHIEDAINTKTNSPIDFKYGLETMLVVKAAHMSSKLKRNIGINYSKGFNDQALKEVD